MDKVLRLFLETSTFNFYVDGKQGQKQMETQQLFTAIGNGKYEAYTSTAIGNGKYEAYTSTAVIKELKRAPKAKYDAMNALVGRYVKKVLKPNAEAKRLADAYVKKHIIPPKSWDDGLHIAVATVENLDFVVSCNMGHIDKRKTMIGTGFINVRAGYEQPRSRAAGFQIFLRKICRRKGNFQYCAACKPQTRKRCNTCNAAERRGFQPARSDKNIGICSSMEVIDYDK
jgi:hypothetical protein